MRESEKYQVYTHSRRLIRHVKFNGDVIREYEYHKDGQTRLFTLPYRVIQNRNTDICVVNKTSGSSSEPMILSSSGCVNVVSRGQAVVKKCLFFDVVCDSHSNIILSDMKNGHIHLLGSDGGFLKFLLTQDEIRHPTSMSLINSALWIGNNEGLVKKFVSSNMKLPRNISIYEQKMFIQTTLFWKRITKKRLVQMSNVFSFLYQLSHFRYNQTTQLKNCAILKYRFVYYSCSLTYLLVKCRIVYDSIFSSFCTYM